MYFVFEIYKHAYSGALILNKVSSSKLFIMSYTLQVDINMVHFDLGHLKMKFCDFVMGMRSIC